MHCAGRVHGLSSTATERFTLLACVHWLQRDGGRYSPFQPELKKIIPDNENVRYVYYNKIINWAKQVVQGIAQRLSNFGLGLC